MSIIDTHAHLDQLRNLDEALTEAFKAGVEAIVAVSMDLESCRKNLEIKRKYSDEGSCRPLIYLAMGMHPSEADLSAVEDCVRFIRAHADALSAIGEIGLDFWYKWVRKDQQKKDEQRKTFRTFLQLAKELDLPAVIHSRGVWRECLKTTREVGLKKAVFHWYSGPVDVLEDIIQSGYYVSTTPSLAYSPPSREAMSQAAIERVLIETDCPVYYKNRETDEGFQAAPKDVMRTLKAYCALKDIPAEKAVGILNRNAKVFFNIS